MIVGSSSAGELIFAAVSVEVTWYSGAGEPTHTNGDARCMRIFHFL